MNTAKIYKDSKGRELTIHQMVKREPEWAASRIQAGEDAIACLQKALEKRNRLLVLAIKHCPREHYDWQELLRMAKEADCD